MSNNTTEILHRYRSYILYLLLPLLSGAMHWQVFSTDLMGPHVWRQTQTQITVLNFARQDMNILQPRQYFLGDSDGLFLREFPVMQWLFAGVYKATGSSDIWITRVLSFVLSILSVWGLYHLVGRVFNNKVMGLLAAWGLCFSPLFYYYAMSPMPDNFALTTAIWGLALLVGWYHNERLPTLVGGMLLMALSTAAKLPFILMMIVPLAYMLVHVRQHPQQPFTRWYKAAAIGVLCFLPVVAWYAYVVPTWPDDQIVYGWFNNPNISLKGVLKACFTTGVVIFPTQLLNLFALPFFVFGLYHLYKHRQQHSEALAAFGALAIIMALFYVYEIPAIGTIHPYYLMPVLPALFVFAGFGAYHLLHKSKATQALAAICLLCSPVLAYSLVQPRWQPATLEVHQDLYTYHEELRNALPDSTLCIMGNDESGSIMFYYLDKKGWKFAGNWLPDAELESYMDRGAMYLYSNNWWFDARPEFKPYRDSLIIERGNVSLYKLKYPDR